MRVSVKLLAVDGCVGTELDAMHALRQVVAVDVLRSCRRGLYYLVLVLDERQQLTVHIPLQYLRAIARHGDRHLHDVLARLYVGDGGDVVLVCE